METMLNISGRRNAERSDHPSTDRGSVMVMAAIISVVVFGLAAVLLSFADRESTASNGDRERASAVEAAHVEALARRLLADPAFHFGKVSAAKRHLLATAMFPDEEARLLNDVVDLAQRLDWLNQSGFEGMANR